MIFTISIDEGQTVQVIDDTGDPIPNQMDALTFIRGCIDMQMIEDELLTDKELSKNEFITNHVVKITRNYFAEKENFLEENAELILRLALADTQEDLNAACCEEDTEIV